MPSAIEIAGLLQVCATVKCCTAVLRPWLLIDSPPLCPLPALQTIRALRFDGTRIPAEYDRDFQRALWTFMHQRVYCPRRNCTVQ
jgi:hypothetical protein